MRAQILTRENLFSDALGAGVYLRAKFDAHALPETQRRPVYRLAP